MLAHDLIAEGIPAIDPHRVGEEVLRRMEEYEVMHLPVVGNGQFMGLLSEEEILKNGVDTPVETYLEEMSKISVHKNDHLFDVMKKMTDSDITTVPVTDEEGHYLGLITRKDLFDFYGRSFAWSEPGSILVLDLEDVHYSLSEISRIIEAEQGMIISSIISRPSETRILLTLKINQLDVTRIVAALRRYDYEVTASYTEAEVADHFKERYDAFMRYLDV
jgi:CBS domain-containing protein